MKEKLAQLLSIKSLVTLAVTGVFCYMAVQGQIDSNVCESVFSTILAFYCGTVYEKKSK